MEVKRYVYQSPYNAPVQFGRPDPTTQQSENAEYELNNKSEVHKKAQIVKNELQDSMTENTQTKNSKSTLQPRMLDVYV